MKHNWRRGFIADDDRPNVIGNLRKYGTGYGGVIYMRNALMAPAQTPEIEITQKMIDAGISALIKLDVDDDGLARVACAVFCSMYEARQPPVSQVE